MVQFTDSHCHLDDSVFAKQLPNLLAQCHQLAIKRIIIPSTSPDNFDDVLSLAQDFHNKPIKLYPCLGIHPWFLTDLDDSHLELLNQSVARAKQAIIAIGEIGIDGANIKRSDNPELALAKQQHFFDYQLNLAKQHNLPVIVHHRQSHQYIVPMLKRYQLTRSGIIHGFSGSYQQAKDYIDLGFKLGVGSTISFSRAKKTINTIKRLPLESLVLETDAPSMPLSKELLNSITLSKEDFTATAEQAHNSPVNLVQVFQLLADIREESPTDIAEKIEQNIEQIFFS